jgi:hypothetical protein
MMFHPVVLIARAELSSCAAAIHRRVPDAMQRKRSEAVHC